MRAVAPRANRTAGRSSSLAGHHVFRLSARPRACLALGETRAPRAPYSSLAQLARCEPPLGSLTLTLTLTLALL